MLMLVACNAPAPAPLYSPLIKVEALRQMMQERSPLVLIDVRPEAAFLQGHLPGAVNFWRPDLELTDTAYGGLALRREIFAERLGEKGITSAHRAVLYDDKGGVEAARVLWILKRYGHDNLHVLDGGLQAWGSDLQTGATQATPAVFEFEQAERMDMNLDYATFEAWRKHTGVRLIDNRSALEFSGEEFKKGAFFAGHVPGATQFCQSNCMNQDAELSTKTLDELRAMYAPMASPDDTVLVYCHSGVRSAHVWFVLSELLGYKHVYNYDGSWIEWSYFNRPDSLNKNYQQTVSAI
jgi:thiosulfate/3-mercaptopyruvate sulfurtransferase